MTTTPTAPPVQRGIATVDLTTNPFSIELYGRSHPRRSATSSTASAPHGILVPLVVHPTRSGWEVLSGHRRLACARALGLSEVPCEVREVRGRAARRLAVLEYNRQRRKTFSQIMREADALESLLAAAALRRRQGNLRQVRDATSGDPADRRNSDDGAGRTDSRIARALGLGGKDLYRQARAVCSAASGSRTTREPAPPASRSLTPGQGSRSTRLIKTYAAATGSPLAFARPPTTSGRSSTTGPLASRTRARSRRRSSPTRSITTPAQAPSSSTRWPAAGRPWTSAPRWDAAVLRTTCTQYALISRTIT